MRAEIPLTRHDRASRVRATLSHKGRGEQGAASLHHRAVDDVLDLLAIIFAQVAGGRGSDHDDEALLRVAEERGAVGAVPGELAGIAGHRGQALAGTPPHRKSKAKTAAMRLDIGDVVL